MQAPRNYGKAFRIVRAALGLMQAEFAESICITTSALSKIETGKRQPSAATVRELTLASGASDELITALAMTPRELQAALNDLSPALAESLLRFLAAADESHFQRTRRLRRARSGEQSGAPVTT